MKISLITLHRVFNYGSILQTYATQQILKSLGHTVEVIDYITEERTLFKELTYVPPFLENRRLPIRFAYILAQDFSYFLKSFSFGPFLKKYVSLTPQKYISSQDLINDPPVADIYVAGSDQVWNSHYNGGIDEGFFLTFAPKGSRKISFVSSFGSDNLPDNEKERTRHLLQDFYAISVRETSGLEILKELGRPDAVHLIDPTLQIPSKDWLSMASPRLIKDPYVLLMILYNEDNNATIYARRVADEKGLKLVKLSWDPVRPPLVDHLMSHRSPLDFLSLFAHAEYVVTNSFHGLAFSINFNRQFAVVQRSQFNGRIASLLQLTGLNDRILSGDPDQSVPYDVIDYDPVNLILHMERKKALQFLQCALA